MSILPDSFHRRSLTYHIHDPIEYHERDSATVVHHYSAADNIEQVRNCGLLDFSELQRTGLRGPGTKDFLAKLQLPFPEQPNQLQTTDNGMLVARLGSTECWLLDNPLGLIESGDFDAKKTNHSISDLDNTIQDDSGVYPLYCQHSHAWFALTGNHLPPLMAKICGVDLHKSVFPIGTIAQTSIARVNGIIMHHQLNGIPIFSILSDSSSAEYLWHALIDAMAEFQGEAIGLCALTTEI